MSNMFKEKNWILKYFLKRYQKWVGRFEKEPKITSKNIERIAKGTLEKHTVIWDERMVSKENSKHITKFK